MSVSQRSAGKADLCCRPVGVRNGLEEEHGEADAQRYKVVT